MNVKAISRNVGMALMVSALFMLLGAVISFADGRDSSFGPLLVSFFITFIVGSFPLIFVRQQQNISQKDGYVIIILAWTLSFVFGMMPYVLWGGEMSIADAWFESVSGYTTTGATILNDIEALPRGLLFFRASTHFIGGLGVVVFLLLIIPSASPFIKRLTRLEVSSLSKEGNRIQSRKLVRVMCIVYFSIFVLATFSLFVCGMDWFDAVTHGFSLCATGGFSVKNASMAAYDSHLLKIVSMVFMVIATINFVQIYSCFVRRSVVPVFKSRAVRFYLGSIVLMSTIVVLSLRFQTDGEFTWGRAALEGIATTISYVTTTGFAFADNSSWPMLACAVLVYASMQCACAGSTSSGLKVDRIVVAFKAIGRQIKSNLHPTSTNRIKIGETYVPDEQVSPLILYFVLYFLVLGVSTLLLLAMGVGSMEAISGPVACLGNVGPGLADISIAGNYDSLPSAAKLLLTLDMFLGRIEIYPFLITISLIFNKKNN